MADGQRKELIWLKLRDGTVIWYDEVLDKSPDGTWVTIGGASDSTGSWLDAPIPLGPVTIRWSEVVAYGVADRS